MEGQQKTGKLEMCVREKEGWTHWKCELLERRLDILRVLVENLVQVTTTFIDVPEYCVCVCVRV